MGALTRIAVKLGSATWAPRILPAVESIDRRLQQLSRGRTSLLDLAGLPNLILKVPGKATGIMRSTPLLAVPEQLTGGDSPTWLIAGSYFGNPHTPAWVNNVRAATAAEIVVKGEAVPVTASELASTDRDEAWAALVAVWPNFTLYQQRTSRVIPVFRLTPS